MDYRSFFEELYENAEPVLGPLTPIGGTVSIATYDVSGFRVVLPLFWSLEENVRYVESGPLVALISKRRDDSYHFAVYEKAESELSYFVVVDVETSDESDLVFRWGTKEILDQAIAKLVEYRLAESL
jgi:hypothetical protein